MMRKLKVTCVCGFGLGSSMLLKMKVDEMLKKHDIIVSSETADMGSATSSNCDVIFTSYELGEKMKAQTNIPIVMIKNFMDLNEIETAGLAVVQDLIANLS